MAPSEIKIDGLHSRHHRPRLIFLRFCLLISQTLPVIASPSSVADENATTDASNEDNFRRLRINDDPLFVDKSAMIAEFLDVDSPSVICITRPSGWGKTTNLDMLSRFLELETDRTGEPLPLERCRNRPLFFGGLVNATDSSDDDADGSATVRRIGELLKICRFENAAKLQGTFPVIRLDFGRVGGRSVKQIEERIRNVIADLFGRYDYVTENLQRLEKAKFRSYRLGTASTKRLKSAVPFLSALLCEYYDSKVCVLIDDYDRALVDVFVRSLRRRTKRFKPDPGAEECVRLDKRMRITPDHDLHKEAEFREVFEFFQTFYENAFKRNLALFRGFLTGVFDVRFDDIFGGFNNVRTYTLQDKPFSAHYGFSAGEINRLTGRINLTDDDKTSLLRDYGYDSNGTVICSPRTFRRFVSGVDSGDKYYFHRPDDTVYLDYYLLNGNDETIRNDVYRLSNGEKIRRFVTSAVPFNDISSWTFSYLLFKGYVNASRLGFDRLELSVVNSEVREYIRHVAKSLRNDSRTTSASRAFEQGNRPFTVNPIEEEDEEEEGSFG